MEYDPRVEGKAELIAYHIQTNEGIHLSDKSMHDIFFTVRDVANYWREDSDKLRKENHAKRWNELTLWLRKNKDASVEDIQHIMEMLNEGRYVRDERLK